MYVLENWKVLWNQVYQVQMAKKREINRKMQNSNWYYIVIST